MLPIVPGASEDPQLVRSDALHLAAPTGSSDNGNNEVLDTWLAEIVAKAQRSEDNFQRHRGAESTESNVGIQNLAVHAAGRRAAQDLLRGDGSLLAANAASDQALRFPDAVRAIETISQAAVGDDPRTQRAAQHILATLLTSKGGTAIRSTQKVLQWMSEAIRRRNDSVGTSARFNQPLGEKEMDAAVDRWKADFETGPDMHQHTKDKILEWRKENTRSSKKQAREAIRKTWRNHVEETCGSFQLTMLFLRYPPTPMHTLLQAHAEYMASPAHSAQVRQSRKQDERDEQAVEQKTRQVELKCRMACMRAQRRRVIARGRKIKSDEISAPRKNNAAIQKWKKWRLKDWGQKLARLDARLDAATEEYGQLVEEAESQP